jgi:hypothetical protein
MDRHRTISVRNTLDLAKTVRKSIFFSVTIFTVLGAMSCATYYIRPTSDLNTGEIHLDRGVEYVVQRRGDIGLIIAAARVDNEIQFFASIKNFSDRRIRFTDDAIAFVQGYDPQSQWADLRTYTAREYYDKERTEYITGAVLLAVAAAADTASAGYGNASSSGSFSGTAGGSSYWGTYRSSTEFYDPAAAQLAIANNQREAASYANRGETWLTFLEDNLLWPSDIAPDGEYSGFVYAENGGGPRYHLQMEIDDKDFDLYFERSDLSEMRNPEVLQARPRWGIKYSFTPLTPLGGEIAYYRTDGIGGYAGFRASLVEYGSYDTGYESVGANNVVDGVGDYTFRSEEVTQFWEPYAGLNFHLTGPLWIKAGATVLLADRYTLADHYFSTGTYWDTRWIQNVPMGIAVGPQVSIDFLLNPIQLGIGVIAPGFETVQVDITGGITF